MKGREVAPASASTCLPSLWAALSSAWTSFPHSAHTTESHSLSFLQPCFFQKGRPAFPGPEAVPSHPVTGTWPTEHSGLAVAGLGFAWLPLPPPSPRAKRIAHCLRLLASPFPTGPRPRRSRAQSSRAERAEEEAGQAEGAAWQGDPPGEVTSRRENSVTERRQL